MADLRSSVSEASAVAGELKGSDLTISSVDAASEVNVPVNEACMATYNGGKSALASYHGIASKDAEYITNFAVGLALLDKKIGAKYK